MASLKRIIHTLGLVAACDGSSPSGQPDAHVPADAAVMTDAEASLPPVEGGGLSGGALAGTIDVHIVDARDGQPVPGAAIRVDTRELAADETGHARLTGLSGQTLRVSASADGFVPSSWLGVGAAQVTIPLASTGDSAGPGGLTRVRIEGLASLPTRDDGGTYLLRLLTSLPPDLRGFDVAGLTSAHEASLCRFSPGELDACMVEVDTHVGAQRLYGVVEAVDALGELLEPVALFVSGPLELAAGVNLVPGTLSLLPASELLRVDMLPVLPPVDGAKVVGVPGMKLSDGVMVFPPSARVLLPRSGGTLEGSYWYISEATYTDADGDALAVRVARRGLSGDDELAPDPWPQVSARPLLASGRLTFTAIADGVRQVRVRDQVGAPLLDAVMLEGTTELELPSDVASSVASVEMVETFAPFDPLAFALPEVLSETLQRVQRVSALAAD